MPKVNLVNQSVSAIAQSAIKWSTSGSLVRMVLALPHHRKEEGKGSDWGTCMALLCGMGGVVQFTL